MAVYDITVPLKPNVPTYDGEPGPRLDFPSRIANGDASNVSTLFLGSHTGTHIDAPHHFIDGAPTVETIPAEALVGQAFVFEHRFGRHITASDLEAANVPEGTQRLLLKTPNSGLWSHAMFRRDYVALDESAARWVVDHEMHLVGIDYLSIERYDTKSFEVHKILLSRGVVILEGLNLHTVPQGLYLLACGALNVVGAEGAPARAFLIDIDGDEYELDRR